MSESTQPLFTVIIPNYNMGKWVKDSITSVLNQTYADFELIVIDNCSTDQSREEIASIKDSRLKSYTQVSNIGMYANLNVALMLAKGKYIKIHCSDDVLHPQCLSVLEAAIHKLPASSKPFYIGYEMLVGEKGESCPDAWYQKNLLNDLQIAETSIHKGIATGLPNVCVDAAAFRDFGGFGTPDPQRDFSRDMLRLGLFSEHCHCVTVALPLSFERAHEGQSRYSMSKQWQLNEMYLLKDSTGALDTPVGKVAIRTLAGHHLASSLKAIASGKGFGYLIHTLSFSFKKQLIGTVYFKAFVGRLLKKS